MTTDSRSPSPSGPGPERPLRILHLEDDPNDAELIRADLVGEGVACDVVHVDNRAGYLAALEKDIDVILSDYGLPGFSGTEALRLAREQRPEIPFIFVSGTIGEETAIETIRTGATDYVLKHRLARLAPAIRRALNEATERRSRKMAEAAFRQSEDKYESIVETTNEWIWTTDREGRLTFTNPAVSKILGYAPEEVLGRDRLSLVLPDDQQSLAARFADSAARKHGWSGLVARWRHKDGTSRYLESNAVPVLDGQNRLNGYQGADRDITERRRLEQQLQQAQKMEAVGRLAGGVAHDFNNLLTVILGYSDFLLAQAKDSPLRNDILEIKKAGERAASLTRQLLAFSRRQVMQPKVVDLNTLLLDMEKMLRRLIGEDIEFNTVLGPALWPVHVDPGQMEQVILNLAVNARDAMPQGGRLTVETANVRLDEAAARQHEVPIPAGSYVRVTVSDTGLGMSAEVKSHLFEPFFTTKDKEKGTGLGLSTVYGIVKQSNGYVWVVSEPGRGAAFKICLPRAQELLPAAAPAIPAPSLRLGAETVLLVEDEDMVRKLTVSALEKNGYRVLAAPGAEEALAILKSFKEPVHLLVTDVIMPQMSGPELAERAGALRPGLRALFMSGYTDHNVLKNGMLAEGLFFLQKPFSPDALTAKVRDVLDSPRKPRRPGGPS